MERCWPRARAGARGAAVTVEAGDVLVMPQGVWHQVHSLDAHNVSVNLLFAIDESERGGASSPADDPRLMPTLAIATLPAARQPAALANLAKQVEGLVARLAGPQQLPAVMAAIGRGGGEPAELADVVRVTSQLLSRCLDRPSAERANHTNGALPLPSVEEFARSWFDPRRFEGLPMR